MSSNFNYGVIAKGCAENHLVPRLSQVMLDMGLSWTQLWQLRREQ